MPANIQTKRCEFLEKQRSGVEIACRRARAGGTAAGDLSTACGALFAARLLADDGGVVGAARVEEALDEPAGAFQHLFHLAPRDEQVVEPRADGPAEAHAH